MQFHRIQKILSFKKDTENTLCIITVTHKTSEAIPMYTFFFCIVSYLQGSRKYILSLKMHFMWMQNETFKISCEYMEL